MTLTLQAGDLLDYTDWQRGQWRERLRREGRTALTVSIGPHGDGRMDTVGALIRHIFSAELRYVERIMSLPLTDTSVIPTDDVEALFGLGAESRGRFRKLVESYPAERWDEALEFPLMNSKVRVTPRKIVLHVLTHEIRHWAQVGTLLRLQGFTGDFQDLIFAPVLGGGIQR